MKANSRQKQSSRALDLASGWPWLRSRVSHVPVAGAKPAEAKRKPIDRMALARKAWAVWAFLLAAVFIYSVPVRMTELANAPGIKAGLENAGLGFGADVYAYYSVGLEVVYAVAFFTVGLLIFARNRGDWLSMYVSLTLVTFGVGAAPMLHTVASLTRQFPWTYMPQAVLAFLSWSLLHIFTFIFPDGRFTPRWIIWAAVLTEALLVPWFLLPADSPLNPWTWHPALTGAVILAIGVTPTASQIYRYAHSTDPAYKHQIKWVVFGFAIATLGVLGFLLPLIDPVLQTAIVQPEHYLKHGGASPVLYEMVGTTITLVTGLFTPIAIGFSIMRYRLWAIDVILNRTLVYVPLTAILAGLYAASVVLMQTLFVQATGNRSDMAIVVSTLFLASLFTPVKNALQTRVDKRFKDVPNPTKSLQAFDEQVRSVVQVLNRGQAATRLLEEATAAFDAVGGAVYLGQKGHMRLVQHTPDWTGEARLVSPLRSEGTRLGMLALGARRGGQHYTEKDMQVLEGVIEKVSRAARIDQLEGFMG